MPYRRFNDALIVSMMDGEIPPVDFAGQTRYFVEFEKRVEDRLGFVEADNLRLSPGYATDEYWDWRVRYTIAQAKAFRK